MRCQLPEVCSATLAMASPLASSNAAQKSTRMAVVRVISGLSQTTACQRGGCLREKARFGAKLSRKKTHPAYAPQAELCRRVPGPERDARAWSAVLTIVLELIEGGRRRLRLRVYIGGWRDIRCAGSLAPIHQVFTAASQAKGKKTSCYCVGN